VYLAGQLVLIVEVFTVNLSTEYLSYLTQKADLLRRIRSVPIPVKLKIRVNRRTAKLEPGTNKRIATKLEKWLGNTDSGSVTIEGVNFEIIGHRVAGSSADPCILYSIGGKSFFHTNRLKEHIEEKESKYKALGIPLVVAIVPDVLAGLSKATMDDVLIGQEAVDLEDLRRVRDDDSSFKKLTVLNAVLFLWRPSGKWTSKLYVNPFVGVSSDVLKLQRPVQFNTQRVTARIAPPIVRLLEILESHFGIVAYCVREALKHKSKDSNRLCCGNSPAAHARP
jgi:hypothetical protein